MPAKTGHLEGRTNVESQKRSSQMQKRLRKRANTTQEKEYLTYLEKLTANLGPVKIIKYK